MNEWKKTKKSWKWSFLVNETLSILLFMTKLEKKSVPYEIKFFQVLTIIKDTY
jgi:hypothetical protein